ncbi:MAG TPA: DUF5320 domain-containing protein [Draconibacterium sp.]|jgi:hypothetical protein|nr:DUF5320 domain-containing protein [Draconibacterium sp.]
MPGFDKTGPTGQGSKTGRGKGECRNDKETPTEDILTRFGRGLGRRLRLEGNPPAQGRGMGRRFRGGN